MKMRISCILIAIHSYLSISVYSEVADIICPANYLIKNVDLLKKSYFGNISLTKEMMFNQINAKQHHFKNIEKLLKKNCFSEQKCSVSFKHPKTPFTIRIKCVSIFEKSKNKDLIKFIDVNYKKNKQKNSGKKRSLPYNKLKFDKEEIDKQYDQFLNTYSKVALYVQQMAENHFNHVRFLEEKSLESELNQLEYDTYIIKIFCLKDEKDINLINWVEKFKKGLNGAYRMSSVTEQMSREQPIYRTFENMNCLKNQTITFECDNSTSTENIMIHE